MVLEEIDIGKREEIFMRVVNIKFEELSEFYFETLLFRQPRVSLTLYVESIVLGWIDIREAGLIINPAFYRVYGSLKILHSFLYRPQLQNSERFKNHEGIYFLDLEIFVARIVCQVNELPRLLFGKLKQFDIEIKNKI